MKRGPYAPKRRVIPLRVVGMPRESAPAHEARPRLYAFVQGLFIGLCVLVVLVVLVWIFALAVSQ